MDQYLHNNDTNNQILELVFQLANGNSNANGLHSEPWKDPTKVSYFYQIPKQDQDVVDQKYQALDESVKGFIGQIYPTLSEDQEESLLTEFQNLNSKELSSMLENGQKTWQWLFEDPRVWMELSEEQRLAVRDKFPNLPEHLRGFAARYVPSIPKIREPFFNTLANFSGQYLISKLEHLKNSTEPSLWPHIDPKCANLINYKLSVLRPEEKEFAKRMLLKMPNKEQKLFLFDIVSLNPPKLSEQIKAEMEKVKNELLILMEEKKERLMCPACIDLPSGKIFCCSNQHVICSTCLPRLVGNTCPSCREALGARPRRHIHAEAGVRELQRLREVVNRITG